MLACKGLQKSIACPGLDGFEAKWGLAIIICRYRCCLALLGWCLVALYRPQDSRRLKESNSPPARWGLLDFIRVVLVLLLLLLLHHLCLQFHVHFRLANSSPSSSPTSARSGEWWISSARVWAHWAPLDLNLGPASSVSTAGPSELTNTADLNLGPAELSEHRWTSTAR